MTRLSQVRPGDYLRVTAPTGCPDAGEERIVMMTREGDLFVVCDEGEAHLLDGHLLDDGDTLVGFERAGRA